MLQSQGLSGSVVSDLSSDSSPPLGYPDFPPSPDSWLGDTSTVANNNKNSNSTSSIHY